MSRRSPTRAERRVAGVERRVARIAASPLPVVTWLVLVAAATACLVCAMLPVGPAWLGPAGAVTVTGTYAWALAARTGGRPVVFGTLALALGLATVLTDQQVLETGAAVLTAAVAGVLGVMSTVPAKGFPRLSASAWSRS